jgi:hypothetical protein
MADLDYQQMYQVMADKLAVAESQLEEQKWIFERLAKYESTIHQIRENTTSCRTFDEDGDDRNCITQGFPEYMKCAYCLALGLLDAESD